MWAGRFARVLQSTPCGQLPSPFVGERGSVERCSENVTQAQSSLETECGELVSTIFTVSVT